MKIITPGKIPKKHWWSEVTFRCKKCNCVFELEDSDKPSEWSEHVVKVVCPTCNSNLSATRDKVEKQQVKTESAFTELFENLFGPFGKKHETTKTRKTT